MGVCSFECSFAILVVKGRVPAVYDVVALVAGSCEFGLIGRFEAEALSRIPLP